MEGADAISAVRELLPWWVGWSQVPVFILLTLMLAPVFIGIGILITGRGPEAGSPAHWTERARQAWASRRVSAVGAFLIVVPLAVITTLFSSPLSRVPTSLAIAGILVAGYGIHLWVSYRRARRLLGAWITAGYFLSGTVTVMLIAYPHVVVALLLAVFLPGSPDMVTLALFLFAVGIFLYLLRGGSIAIAEKLGLVFPASTRLEQVVERCVAQSGVRPRSVYEMRLPMANALALPMFRRVFVTDRALKVLDDTELQALCSHELGHLTDSRWREAMRLLMLSSLLIIAAFRPIIEGVGFEAYLILVVIYILLGRIGFRILQGMEKKADLEAIRIETDPAIYARALEKIHADCLTPAVLPKRADPHPDLYDRMVRAGVTPDYPKPEPPDSRKGRIYGLVLIALFMALTIGLCWLKYYWASRSERNLIWSLSLFGGQAREMSVLGYFNHWDGKPEEAAVFYRAAAFMEPEAAHHAANLAIALADSGRPAEAEAALENAEVRAADVEFDERPHDLLQSAREAVARLRAEEGFD